jgi:hypothetical protein
MVRSEHLDALVAQGVESLRTCYLVCIEAVYVKLGGTVLHVLYYVGVPDFVK